MGSYLSQSTQVLIQNIRLCEKVPDGPQFVSIQVGHWKLRRARHSGTPCPNRPPIREYQHSKVAAKKGNSE
ncbi:hypothetical protein CEXT_86051 [Caerostris extrusa]|uniref:Uncharacterized protein n=1 Tax=Caerostris extrusa TaxID=172846 RepID=A0AAV4SCF1_CAEEX|nr:hypothetical protein CEXT_86051 [Caerostris extrusa]